MHPHGRWAWPTNGTLGYAPAMKSKLPQKQTPATKRTPRPLRGRAGARHHAPPATGTELVAISGNKVGKSGRVGHELLRLVWT